MMTNNTNSITDVDLETPYPHAQNSKRTKLENYWPDAFSYGLNLLTLDTSMLLEVLAVSHQEL